MARLRTDREILRAIYDQHYDDFVSFERRSQTRGTKILVPIDIPAIAKSLGAEDELVFGRLYYHLAPKYERVEGDKKITFFEISIQGKGRREPERHVVNFPLLESILATLEYEERKFRLPFLISSASLAVALCALVFTGLTALTNLSGKSRSESAQTVAAPPPVPSVKGTGNK